MNIEGLTKYLEETGLAKRFEEIKPGDSFGVEIPIDDEGNKWLRFWLSTEGSEDEITHVTLDFEGLIRVRVCCDEKKLEDWIENSGILELAKMADEAEAETEKEETEA